VPIEHSKASTRYDDYTGSAAAQGYEGMPHEALLKLVGETGRPVHFSIKTGERTDGKATLTLYLIDDERIDHGSDLSSQIDKNGTLRVRAVDKEIDLSVIAKIFKAFEVCMTQKGLDVNVLEEIEP